MSSGAVVSHRSRTASVDLSGGYVDYRLIEAQERANAKYAAAVVVKISLRSGDNTDVLEALGLIPATETHVLPPVKPILCPWCDWSTSPGKDQMVAFRAHRTMNHKGEHA